MLLKSNIDHLKKILDSNRVLSSKEECYCYSQDAGNFVDENALADVVVFVQTVEEIQNIVKYANQHKIPIISRGAGTNMVGACVCEKGGIVLNFSKMNKILDFNPEDMTITVQAGAILNDIKTLVEKEGLYYPPDPSNFKVSTIGGSIAQSSGGAKSFKYGTTKDYILSMNVVLADGTLMKLGSGMVKDAVGYHLNQLIVGSEGTLAIVADATLKLIPRPETSTLITAYFDSLDECSCAVNNIIKSRVFPSTIDFMDKNSINTIEEFYPCGLDCAKEAMLLIEVDGSENSVQEQAEIVVSVLNGSKASSVLSVHDEKQKEDIWTARRASFAATAKLAPDVLSDDLIVPRSKLAEMVTKTKAICNKYGLQVCIVGHVGDGNIHPQIALNLENDDEYKNYMNAKSEIYNLAVALGGTISAEHGVGIEKRQYMEKILDKTSLEYMKQIKKLFDPNNILNPDKIFKL